MRELKNPTNLTGEAYEKIKEFWESYGYLFDGEQRFDFRHNLLKAYMEKELPTIYLSIYSYMGILQHDKDIYSWFLSYLKECHPEILNQNILEVACGKVPALVKLISDEIKNTASIGTITGMDGNLVLNQLSDATLKRRNITYRTDISLYDTLIGLAPCEAAPITIKKACAEQKEFSLMMCGCIHNVGYYYPHDYTSYLNYLYGIAKSEKNDNFKIDVEYAPDYLDFDYPILSLTRK